MKIKDAIEQLNKLDLELELLIQIYDYDGDEDYAEAFNIGTKCLNENYDLVDGRINKTEILSHLSIYKDQLAIAESKRKGIRNHLAELFLSQTDPQTYDIENWRAIENEHRNIQDNIARLERLLEEAEGKEYAIIYTYDE